jgi:hypothetical protein
MDTNPSSTGGRNTPGLPSSQARRTPTTQAGAESGAPPSNPSNPAVSTLSEARNNLNEQNGAPEGSSKKKSRRNKRRKHRRPSFAAPPGDPAPIPVRDMATPGQIIEEDPQGVGSLAGSAAPAAGHPLYRLGQTGANHSSTSLESEALLDHR